MSGLHNVFKWSEVEDKKSEQVEANYVPHRDVTNDDFRIGVSR